MHYKNVMAHCNMLILQTVLITLRPLLKLMTTFIKKDMPLELMILITHAVSYNRLLQVNLVSETTFTRQ